MGSVWLNKKHTLPETNSEFTLKIGGNGRRSVDKYTSHVGPMGSYACKQRFSKKNTIHFANLPNLPNLSKIASIFQLTPTASTHTNSEDVPSQWHPWLHP